MPAELSMTGVKTSAYTAVAGDLVLVDTFTGGGFSVTLPVSAPINTKIGMMCINHDPTKRDEVDFDAGIDLIGSGHDGKVYLTDDVLTLQADGTGVWRILDDMLIAHRGRMALLTQQLIVNNTTSKLLCNVIENSNAGLFDTGNSWGTIRRTGYYNVNVGVSTVNMAVNANCINMLYKQAVAWAQEAYSTRQNHGGPYISTQRNIFLIAGDIIENFYYQNSGGNVNTAAGVEIQNPYITIEENR